MPPPNTPEEGLLPNANNANNVHNANTTILALRPIVRREAPPASTPTVDLHALEYDGPVDENLICPICRVPLVSPVITHCDHVFCHRCLVTAHALNPCCPVDRLPLRLVSETHTAPKIVHNQLDNLPVKCPNRALGCGLVVARSLVENHVSRYCEKTLVPCPHPSCDKTVARRDVGKGCLHYDVSCEFCDQTLQRAELEEHQEKECPNRKTGCELCGAEYARNKQDDHARDCPEVEASCRFAAFGCGRKMARKALDEHAEKCEYRVVSPVGEQLAELSAQLSALQEKDRLKDRRIKFLENRGFPVTAAAATTTSTTAENVSDMHMSEESPASADPAPYESRDQYFLSLFETMESKVERLSSALTEVEGRHSMMLFNETLQIKDQLTEIRSTLGVLGMHVRWLMNFRLQERGRVGTGSPGIPASFTGSQADHSSGSNLPRRLSETSRENPSRL
jgi:phage FluMu protein Com